MRHFFFILLVFSYVVNASEIYLPNELPTSNLLDNTDKSVTSFIIPAGLDIGDGRIASGPQTMLVNVDSSSSASLRLSVDNKLTTIAPGESVQFTVDLEYGNKPLEYAIAPSPAIDGTTVNYTVTIPELKSIFNQEGWQEVFNEVNGCQSDLGCETKVPYGKFSFTRIEFNKPSSFKCPKQSSLDESGNCVESVLIPAVKDCPSGFNKGGSNCFKNTSSEPIISYKCPSSSPHGNDRVVSENTKCFSLVKSYICPNGTYLNDAFECVPEADYLGKGSAFANYSCPSSKPYLVHSAAWDHYYCATYPEMQASSWCPAGFEKGVYDNGRCYSGGLAFPEKQSSCPVGFKFMPNGQCNKKEETNFLITCPEGEKFGSSQCEIMTDQGKPIEFCEGGSDLPENGICSSFSINNHSPLEGAQVAPKFSTKYWVK
ncbi:hypothetical protein THF1C08_50313 [Vibrio jasicida]|uniref:Uncharacterized protein n=1 Tax=Vibrio jasicida TaxID=766224 RepID=A0AAU9QWK2_9VIBR|nr:hypothetical protein THF1C08_50313 [Vibrio jasicida]CAH1601420.1 hypothetical protein THF1A12_50033 [Vibrio jasicida]